ncbi:bifunctional phosphopantothenoylcysteine decarboxylase/phosphopantothenate--cysteine ligase CoaBC [Prochlorococcus sp. MIT 1341]|uniref:bifunctional phosphopantothenoylcysteine decarboxylase/phosphopantothenate--cysteine ligase CoaBC n=1 Tax=Prochlorococcus sp. MIT 1341 TaxID=3096221 RepID=UPI002A74B08E|nr:bifunctional phosphopantothenoylcysteine decarboxylase/phosphopantothenate--cysteine ligase CoaBC [Prochlorococcus sp. MIT 1341]
MRSKSTNLLKGRKILVAASGSIAAVKTPLLVSSLIKSGAEVRCLITPSAARLVSPLSLASLSRNKCFQEEDQWSPQQAKPLHIALAEWADLIVVAPLSASSLARWSQGLAEGLLASVLLAFEKPIVAAAAMNTGMWGNQAIKGNWERLKTFNNLLCLEPSEGLLACDRVGEGRMVSNELIQLAIESAFLQASSEGKITKDWTGLRLLTTSGPTVEPLDPARLLTNRSSGKMGVLLAQAAKLRGAKVDLIHGPLQTPEGFLEGLTTYPITNANQMKELLNELQRSANAVVMAAAVADLRLQRGQNNKKVRKEELLSTIQEDLEQVPDLLKEMATKRLPGQVLLGFAALSGEDSEIQKLGEMKRAQKDCDLLMANPIDRDGQGFEVDTNGGWLLGKNGLVQLMPVQPKLQLAHKLLDALLLSGLKN